MVGVGLDRRVDAAEVLEAEMVIAAEVGQHVAVVDRTVVVVVDVEEEGAEDVEEGLNMPHCQLPRFYSFSIFFL